MRLAYLDCFAGIAGDMFLGALLQAGVPAEVMHEATAALRIGASLKVETVNRSGISAVKVHVMEGEALAETRHTPSQEAEAGSADTHQRDHSTEPYSKAPETQHQHKDGHSHRNGYALTHTHRAETAHEHSHAHGRSLTEIREVIRTASLPEAVKATSLRAFEFLGHSEAKIHNVPVDSIHFHEVGAIDAIVDIVAASAGVHHLGIEKWYCSAVNVGGGMVQCAHGNFPVPAPATADLLRGIPTYSAHVQKELTTPTGAALLRALDPVFGDQPRMKVDSVGYGAGTRNPEGFPNVLRLHVGEQEAENSPPPVHIAVPAASNATTFPHSADQAVTVLETALDDLTPQVTAYVAEKLLASGALDVMLTPVIMKKGRPGTLLTVLCNPADSEALQHLLLRETSTLGVRIREDRRACLERAHLPVDTAYGTIRMKVGSLGAEQLNAAPEFEDCRAAAERYAVPLKRVQQAALASFENGRSSHDSK